MDDISRAIHLYQNQKFGEASIIFNQCTQNLNLSIEEIESSYEHLVKIYEILQLEAERIGVEEKYLEFLDQHQLVVKKIDLLKKIVKRKKYYNCYANLRELWFLQIKNGKIQQAKETSKMVLNYLAIRKNSSALKSYLSEYKGQYGENEEYISHLLNTYLIEGDYDLIDQLFGNCNHFDDSTLNYKTFETFLKNLVLSEEVLLGKYRNITNCYLRILLSEQKKAGEDNQKEILNHLHDYIGIHGFDEKSLALLFEYIKIFQSNDLFFDGDYFHDVIEKSLILDDFKKNLHDQVTDLEKTLRSKSVDKPQKKDDSSGFHEFIYRQDAIGKNSEVEKLERDILFLRSIGKIKEAKDKVQLLKKIDENNTIINQTEDTEKIAENNVNPEEDLRLVLGGIDIRTGGRENTTEPDYNLNEIAFVKYIENMDREILVKNVEDISTALFVSGMSQAALFAIEKILKETKSTEKIVARISLEYLSIAILFDMEKFQEVVWAADRVADSYPLKTDEQADFLYYKAESLMRLGYKKDALNLYKKIQSLVNGYRLVNLRLRDVE